MNSIKKIIKKFIRIFFNLPIFKIKNNKIVFDNFNGKGFGGDPKYIALELLKTSPNIEMIWLVKNLNEQIPEGIKKVRINSLKGLYELATAKIWIDNVRNSRIISKKKNQYYIQTWHGTTMIKKIEFDTIETLSPLYIKDMLEENKITDLMISNSSYFTIKCKETFRYYGEILKNGNPSEDYLINNEKKLSIDLKKNLNIKDEKILLYAPTFRNNNVSNPYIMDFTDILNYLNENTKTNWKILIRLHPNLVSSDFNFIVNEDIIDVTDYPDIQDLIAGSDLVITDYSSIMFQAMRINKKVIIYANDIDSYVNERGFYFDFKELPFEITTNINELKKALENKNFNDKYQDFIQKIGYYNYTNSCEEITKIILRKMKGE